MLFDDGGGAIIRGGIAIEGLATLPPLIWGAEGRETVDVNPLDEMAIAPNATPKNKSFRMVRSLDLSPNPSCFDNSIKFLAVKLI